MFKKKTKFNQFFFKIENDDDYDSFLKNAFVPKETRYVILRVRLFSFCFFFVGFLIFF